jgi:transcriptional/translational regulatory protein YebC/TACO1
MEIALEAGADDVLTSEQGYEVRCNVHAFDRVAQALEQKGLKPDSAEIAYIPTTTVPVTDVAVAKALLKLHDALEDQDDVQAIYSNDEMEEAITAAAQA